MAKITIGEYIITGTGQIDKFFEKENKKDKDKEYIVVNGYDGIENIIVSVHKKKDGKKVKTYGLEFDKNNLKFKKIKDWE